MRTTLTLEPKGMYKEMNIVSDFVSFEQHHCLSTDIAQPIRSIIKGVLVSSLLGPILNQYLTIEGHEPVSSIQ